jgi:ABC-type uncharacterized transport system permease subunit
MEITVSSRDVLVPVLSLIFALGVGAGLIAAVGINPLAAYNDLFQGALASTVGLTETIAKAVPICLTGLAAAVAFKSKFFNIGGEGQFYAGTIAATWLGLAIGGFPTAVGIPLLLAGGFIAGVAWIAFPAFLKFRLGVNEIFTTLMINFITVYFVGYLVAGPLLEPGGIQPESSILSTSLWLPALIPRTVLNAGVFVMIIFVLVVYWIMEKTTLGFKIKAVGANARAARYAGISVDRTIWEAIIISGGLAGVAGVLEVLGNVHRLLEGISPFPIGYGYIGIWVALVGRLHSVGVLVSSFLFAVLIIGGQTMSYRSGVPTAIVYVLQGLVVLFIIGGGVLSKRES